MRRILLVTILLLAGFLIAESRRGAESVAARQTAVLCSLDRERGDVWLCERACNSDLDLPRANAAGAVAPAGVQRPANGSAGSRAVVRSLSTRHGTLAARETSFRYAFNPSAVPHAADDYVLRLRRLII